MNDRLDDWLARLPGEPPAPNLAARIIAALAQRRRARWLWRRIQATSLACALAGAGLLLVSSPSMVASLVTTLNAFGTNELVSALNTFLAAPAETVLSWLEAGATWQTSLAQDIGLVFMLGVALVAVAAFGGLAQMLHTREHARALQ
jgi:hypothetical protein